TYDVLETRNQDKKAYSIQETLDDGYVLVGRVWDARNSSTLIMKLDGSGTKIWERKFGNRSEGLSILATLDGGYMVTGKMVTGKVGDRPFYEGGFVGYVMKLDGKGNKVWEKIFNETREIYSIQQTSDGGYVVAGSNYGDSADFNYMYIIKFAADSVIKPATPMATVTQTPTTPKVTPILTPTPQAIKVDIKNTYDVDLPNYLWEITQKSRYPIDVKIDVSVESPDQIDSVVLKFSGLEPSEIDAKPWKIASNHYSIPLKATNPFSMQEIVDTVIYLLSMGVQGTSLIPPTAPPIPDVRLTEAIIVYNNGSRYSTILPSESVTGCAVFDADGCRIPTIGDAKIFGGLFNIGGTMVFSASPVDLLITDDQGRMTGSLYEDGVFTKETNEIPSSFYSGQGLDHQFIYLPEEGRYSIKVFGRGFGQYSLIAIPLSPSNQSTKIEGTIEPSVTSLM
ncbi:MAG: hypothetical protein Q7U60_07855, partial [Candidatus Methanoperedens sp.]|nr:hypothetical protein [Candidatus Methanoperedens sp.]